MFIELTNWVSGPISWFFGTFTSLEEAWETCRTVWRLYRLLAWLARLARRVYRWVQRWYARRSLPSAPERRTLAGWANNTCPMSGGGSSASSTTATPHSWHGRRSHDCRRHRSHPGLPGRAGADIVDG